MEENNQEVAEATEKVTNKELVKEEIKNKEEVIVMNDKKEVEEKIAGGELRPPMNWVEDFEEEIDLEEMERLEREFNKTVEPIGAEVRAKIEEIKNKKEEIVMNDNKIINEIKAEFWNVERWVKMEKENVGNALMLRLFSDKKDKNALLIQEIIKNQEKISKNAKKVKESYQRKLKEKVKEELSKSKIILRETNESAYRKIRRIIDIAELKEIYVNQKDSDIYEIAIEKENRAYTVFEGTVKEVLLMIQILSGYEKEDLYKKIHEKEKEEKEKEKEKMELIKNAPKFTQADFIKDLEENIDKMKAIRGKLKEAYKMMENFIEIVCLGEQAYIEYSYVKDSVADDEETLKKLENIFTIYLQEEIEDKEELSVAEKQPTSEDTEQKTTTDEQ